MSPEQEVLSDTLAWVRQQAETFAQRLADHAAYLPLAPQDDPPPPALETNVLAFVKRFELIQDQISRKLFRSVLVVRGITLRTRALAEVVHKMAELGVIDDPDLWEHATKLRNIFAHDYLLSFSDLVPLVNEAWALSPMLVDMVERVETYVANSDLLVPVEEQP